VRTIVDGGRVGQLIQNLVGNALKYSEPPDRVRLFIGAEDGHAVIRVTDHGIGVPDADIPYLFERFHRGSNTDDRRYRGLGLGLYICRQVANEHGGDISVTSRVDEGTTFTARLGEVIIDGERPVEAAPEPMRAVAGQLDMADDRTALLGGGADVPGEAGA
jgi:signal transduction histidine kinase